MNVGNESVVGAGRQAGRQVGPRRVGPRRVGPRQVGPRQAGKVRENVHPSRTECNTTVHHAWNPPAQWFLLDIWGDWRMIGSSLLPSLHLLKSLKCFKINHPFLDGYFFYKFSD